MKQKYSEKDFKKIMELELGFYKDGIYYYSQPCIWVEGQWVSSEINEKELDEIVEEEGKQCK